MFSFCTRSHKWCRWSRAGIRADGKKIPMGEQGQLSAEVFPHSLPMPLVKRSTSALNFGVPIDFFPNPWLIIFMLLSCYNSCSIGIAQALFCSHWEAGKGSMLGEGVSALHSRHPGLSQFKPTQIGGFYVLFSFYKYWNLYLHLLETSGYNFNLVPLGKYISKLQSFDWNFISCTYISLPANQWDAGVWTQEELWDETCFLSWVKSAWSVREAGRSTCDYVLPSSSLLFCSVSV